MNKTKPCSKCKEVKLLSEYNKNSRSKDGLKAQCRLCCKAYNNQWSKDNKQRKAESTAKWYKENKERKRKYTADWYKNNKERKSQTNKEWLEKNRERRKEVQKEYRRRNKERISEYNKKYQQDKPEISREKTRRYRSRKRELFVEDIKEKELIDRDGTLCSYCRKELEFGTKTAVHVDHVIPLSLGGIHDPNNLVLACRSCNTSKRDENPKDWVRDRNYSPSKFVVDIISNYN